MFKRGRDAILVILDPEADFDNLKSVLESKVGEASRFFGGTSSAVSFTGRTLTENQENELLSILAENANLDITMVLHEDAKKPPHESNQDPDEKADFPRVVAQQNTSRSNTGQLVDLTSKLPQDSIGKQPFNVAEHTTKFQQGSLRSGQIVRFRGSVVVLGDVNPGAEILAEGHVIVLGSLKGLVHAGCMGNDKCYISAQSLTPSQLRIADKITYMPSESKNIGGVNVWGGAPQYAFISDGQIYIAPLLDD